MIQTEYYVSNDRLFQTIPEGLQQPLFQIDEVTLPTGEQQTVVSVGETGQVYNLYQYTHTNKAGEQHVLYGFLSQDKSSDYWKKPATLPTDMHVQLSSSTQFPVVRPGSQDKIPTKNYFVSQIVRE